MTLQVNRRRMGLAILLFAVVAMMSTGIAGGQSTPFKMSSNQVGVSARPSNALANSASIQLTLPAGIAPGSVHAVLNGKDISVRLSVSECEQGTCLTGTVSPADGLRAGKNVVYATGRTGDGKLATGRSRFFQQGTESGSVRGVRALSTAAKANIAPAAGSAGFLPPTVAFRTITSGGWTGTSPWIQIGEAAYPDTSTASCPDGNTYLAIAFNRQTLEASPAICFTNGSTLATYLKTLDSTNLVVAGTLYANNCDAQLDTSAIGGRDHTKDANRPSGYVAVGVGGATPGTAYENYAVNAGSDPSLVTPMWPFVSGILQEDPNGSYNYESSDVLEYWADPFTKDAAADHTGMVTVAPSLDASLANPSLKGYRFLPPNVGSSKGGYWLLVLRRDVPFIPKQTTGCTTSGSPDSDGYQRFSNCGTVYDTGDLDSGTQQTAYQNLANDLNAIGPYDLAFLMVATSSGGYPVCCGTPWDFTGNSTWADAVGNHNPNPKSNFTNFRNALEALGGSGRATLFYDFTTDKFNPTPAYTYVFSRDTGDPLAGNSAVSASAYAAAGQTGYIHGLLARNLNGLFQPFQSSQQQSSAVDQTSGPDYLLSKLSTLPPIQWPELSGTLISGADSVTGQESAYYYASYALLTEHYIKGVSGDFLNDIHFFFTGSNANYINYHYFDPVDLPWPGGAAASYTWSDPVSSVSRTFTQNDFNAVRAQLSTEVVDLTNVLNFMVTGPVNLKNLVATGNSNAGLALTNAAATILASDLTPVTTTTTVKINASNVLSMVGAIVSVAAGATSAGVVEDIAPKLMKGINFWGAALGSTLEATGSGVGGLKSPDSTTTGIPSRFITFTTTVGQLANSSLQDQFGIAFDTSLDSFLGDWGKLSLLGPKITDTSNPTYYSPDQVAQDDAIKILAQASQRSFYMALLPNFYGVYFFPEFAGVNKYLDFVKETAVTNQPDMGSLQDTGKNTTGCAPFFMPGSEQYGNQGQTAPPLGFVWMPSPPYGQSIDQLPWSSAVRNGTLSPSDFYVVAANPPSSPHTTQTSAAFMKDSLSQLLFTPTGFNIPLDLFVGQFGPLQTTWADINTGNRNDSPLGFIPPEICPARQYYVNRTTTVSDPPPPPPPAPTEVPTMTTLVAPASAVIGKGITLQASVSANSAPMTTGNVIFLEDKQSVGTMALDGSGNASITLNDLALGAHTLQALYQGPDGYAPSESSTATLNVYADAADLSLSLSASSLMVSYGSVSSPVTLNLQSLSGMSGSIAFSCSGLPVGMKCNFSPSQTSITADSTAMTSVTISSNSTSASNSAAGNFGVMCILPAGFLLLFGVRRGRRGIERLLCLALLLVAAGSLVACGNSSSNSKPVQETGTKTILVNATCGTVSKSVPLVLNIN